MKISNLDVRFDKFTENAQINGKFILNHLAHAALTYVAVSWLLNRFSIAKLIIVPLAVYGIGVSAHRINMKIANEAKKKDVPASKLLNLETTNKAKKK